VSDPSRKENWSERFCYFQNMFTGCLGEKKTRTGDCPQAQTYVRVWAMLVFDIFHLIERNVEKQDDRESGYFSTRLLLRFLFSLQSHFLLHTT